MDRLSKDRKTKESTIDALIVREIKASSKLGVEKLTYQDLLNMYNTNLPYDKIDILDLL